MQVITVQAQKGGVGKTTISTHLAVQAWLEDPKRQIAILDGDDQGTASKWGLRRTEQRGETAPRVLVGELDQVVEACRQAELDYLFIDTLPNIREEAMAPARVADFCVVPTSPAVPDIEAIGDTIAGLKKMKRNGAILINNGRHGSSVNQKARKVLAGYDFPIVEHDIMRRAIFCDSMIDGGTAMEHQPTSKAAKEILAVWKWIKSNMED